MRKKLTPAFVRDASKPTKGDRVVYWDSAMPSFGLMVTKSGTRSFVYQYRNVRRESRRMTWAVRLDGSSTGLTLDQARGEARKVAGDVERGIDPLERNREERRKAEEERRKNEAAATTTLKAICEEYLTREGGMKRDAGAKATFSGKLRSAKERLQTFERLIYPEKVADRQIDEVKRKELVKLLDKIEDDNGPRMAHLTLAYLSRVFNWHASRDDTFRSPIVRGMGRVKPRERAGKRVLTDEEIRDLWAGLNASRKAGDIPECYVKLVRSLLLTALRRAEAADASWPEAEYLDREDYRGNVLTIPASRMKGKQDHAVPLTPMVLALMGERPKDVKASPFIFSTTDGKRPFSGFSKAKAALNKHIDKLRKENRREPMPAWVLHDLRRTAKTLMTRAGVRPNTSERVLSHVIPGVEGVYDRWGYLPEKYDALTQLAALIERIINPPANNVASLDERRAKGVSQVPG
jgi:integrase